ncbi:UDP-glucose 4-epimerase GalE [Photorhabdus sp. HUG-39]|uniref:UDP-glucose 4-epimerase n=1 Tax=Photorhabdus kayaii TaxID=230088 RepID=A0ABX0AX31_9GAMM|nr:MULTISPECIES: UDP-glucose 4-epimerase GalE [Photorhabdus]MCC8373132.1 UDP-glucose 4-epimerase GalE [Photorhabdus bodei]NDL11754.1 UDP-glucose 4-epimerase GalE [Photorhabdus kayaii]NDL25388.1 UDP-glucose 4-epimerase GalE [Photorhabdus kayaii]RAX10199.1 UDP-glucose 4-epimerase GalE [Photorhabdus sp. HUG-39]
MSILITGGAGYIGSHTVLALLERGTDVVVIDNLCNSSPESLHRVEKLTGKSVKFYQGDILDLDLLHQIFQENKIESVIHFAGLKAVGESTRKPLEYYQNNVTGTLVLLQAMRANDVYQLIFSSSATVYGDPEFVPLTENAKVGGTTNPYGTSKLMVEQILKDFAAAEPNFKITSLRYFNPVGAHPSGIIGEDPNGIPNNLLPYITQVAIGRLECLSVYGNDYPTKDGTGVRDYIHVMDLAEGHIAAIDYLDKQQSYEVFNLGTGAGYSVFDLLHAFEKAAGKEIPHKITNRRPGDIAECWSDPSKALNILGWQATRNIDAMMRDSWNWQKNNPHGFRSEKEY